MEWNSIIFLFFFYWFMFCQTLDKYNLVCVPHKIFGILQLIDFYNVKESKSNLQHTISNLRLLF